MSLVGKLEDLGLGEILQIVALSGKSGILHVKSRGRIGKIFFHKGKVVNAFSDAYRVSLGEYLVRKGYVKQDIINKALELQKQNAFKEKLGTILINNFQIPRDKIEECVVDLIEKSVFSLFYWTEGEFQFELTDVIKREDISVDFMQYDLSQHSGLNPQFLAMEGTRILDEAKKEGAQESLQQFSEQEGVPFNAGTEEAVVTEKSKVAAPKPPILFFDEYPVFRNIVAKHFSQIGMNIISAESLEDAKQKLRQLLDDNKNFVLVTSLIAEKQNGDGILGGLELVNAIPKDANIHIFVSCDYYIPDAEEQLKQWNATLIKKPKRSQLTKENVEKEIKLFIQTLEQNFCDIIEGKGEQKISTPFVWEKELKDEFGITESNANVTTTPGLKLLKSMVAELSNAETGNEIILMILRLASEIMPRAVVFAIKQDRLFGLGQFGLEPFIKEPFKTVKGLSLPLEGKISEVVKYNMPYKGQPPEDETLEKIYNSLGGEKPTEVFLDVITSNNKPLVFFYGDNLPHKKSIHDTDALEIFFTQAGLAMEKLLMGKK